MAKKQKYEIDRHFVIFIVLALLAGIFYFTGWFLGFLFVFILMVIWFIAPLCIKPKN